MDYSISHLGLLDDDEIELDTAALEIAALDHPGIDLDPYIRHARRHRRAGRHATEPDAGPRTNGPGHSGFAIADEFCVSKATANTYESSDNTDLIRVIDRRRGLPVSLTILYVAAARRVGWQADALNTPGHVLGRIGDDTAPVLIDPFASGTIVGPERLVELLGKHAGTRRAAWCRSI